MKKKVILAAFACIVLVIVAVIAFTVGKNSNNKPSFEENTTVETTDKDTLALQKEWSAWSDELPDYVNKKDYEVDERTLYISKKLEKKSSTNKNAYKASDGWVHYDTVEGKGDYGAWSAWSTNPVYNSDSRNVETKKQYSYRLKNADTQYSSWSDWSDWSSTPVKSDDLTRVETRTVWGYYYFQCLSCGAHIHGWGINCYTWAGGCGNSTIEENSWHQVYSPISWDEANLKDWHGSGKYYTYIDGQLVFKWPEGGKVKQYRYSTRTVNNGNSFTNWSEYSDVAIEPSENREVRTRTVYRYRDREENIVYYFKRWGEWSDWSETPIVGSDEVKVETKTQYRYKSK